MPVELKLEPTNAKIFKALHLYQLFQLKTEEDIWIKVDEQFAIKLNSVAFSCKEFSSQVEVVPLFPQKGEKFLKNLPQKKPDFMPSPDDQILEAILLSVENLPLEQASEKLRNTLLGTIINVLLASRAKNS